MGSKCGPAREGPAAGRRSTRAPALASPLTLLDKVALAHRALTAEMARLTVNGADYQALLRASAALAQLAADLGHEGRFAARPSSTVPPWGKDV